MTSPARPSPPAPAAARAPEERWARPEAGERYASRRFRTGRAARRDPRHVVRLLRRHLGDATGTAVLDAPCGAGRLRTALERAGYAWRGLDVSASMLAAARGRGARGLIRGSVLDLPFPGRAFPAVVACRFLHHLADPTELRAAVAELVRVADRLVVVTFWDRACLPELLPRRRRRRRPGRVARPLSELRAAFAAAGAEVVEVRHSLRFLSRQSYVAARRLPGSEAEARR